MTRSIVPKSSRKAPEDLEHLVVVGDVEGAQLDPPAGVRREDLVAQPLEPLGAPGGQGEVPAAVGELAGHLGAEARAGAGDQGGRHGVCPSRRRRGQECADEGGAVLVEEAHDLAELTVGRVARLARVEAVVDLLGDHGEAEGAEHVVEAPLLGGHLEATGRGVALDDLGPGQHPRRVRRLAAHGEEGRVVVGLHPVGQCRTEIHQRVTDGGHLPVEHADDAGRVVRGRARGCRTGSRCGSARAAGRRARAPSIQAIVASKSPTSSVRARRYRPHQPSTWRRT